jgi:hypothetical protein
MGKIKLFKLLYKGGESPEVQKSERKDRCKPF